MLPLAGAGAGLLAGVFLTPLAAAGTGLPPLGAEEEEEEEAGSLALLSAEAGESSLLLRLGGAVGAAVEVEAAAEQEASKVERWDAKQG